MKNKIVLPKSTEDGTPYISYSQIKNWNDPKSFNLRVEGKLEYMMQYFLGDEFPDVGWGIFGTEVEEYILERKHVQNFDDSERKVLDTIKPLDIAQQEGYIKFDGFFLKLYIDDCTKDYMHIRDYKTASLNSSKKYYTPEYWQLDTYGMWVRQETGKLPDKAELVIIEREGNCFRGGGRGVLRVKDEVWYHDRELTEERQDTLRQNIIDTAHEISEYYKVYLKMLEC